MAAFTLDGVCTGSFVWTGETAVLTLWEDDPLTPEKDGFVPGDYVFFRVWSAPLEREFSSTIVRYDDNFDTSGQYSTDAVYLPKLVYFYPRDDMGVSVRGAAGDAAESATRSVTRSAVPDAFDLAANYPNPFNSSTTIRYGLPEPVRVRLEVYDALGRRVATLVNEEQQPAWHEVEFRAAGLAPGIYIVRLRAGDFVSQRQVTLVR